MVLREPVMMVVVVSVVEQLIETGPARSRGFYGRRGVRNSSMDRSSREGPAYVNRLHPGDLGMRWKRAKLARSAFVCVQLRAVEGFAGIGQQQGQPPRKLFGGRGAERSLLGCA